MTPASSPRSGLFRKYATVLIGLVAATVLVGGGAELLFNYRDARASTEALQRAEARAAALRIDEYLGNIRSQVAEVTSLPWTSGFLPAGERRLEYLRLLKVIPAIDDLRHVDEADRERIQVSRTSPDLVDMQKPTALAALVQKARMHGHAFGSPYFKEGFEPFVTLAVREGSTGGVTTAELNLQFVSALVAKLKVGQEGRIFVLDGKTLVAHPNLSLVLSRPDVGASDLGPRLTQAGGDPSIEGRSFEGREVIASAAPVPSTGWVVGVEQPRSEMLAPVQQSLERTLMLMVLGLAAALIASYFLARRLAGPIVKVRHGAERIARGDLNTRIDVQTGDEVETLAAEFNRMADQLQDYTTGLERKVDEKTAALQSALGAAHEAMRARSVFLAAASHDLRQPLYAISILADALAATDLQGEAATVLERQRQAIAVLQTLFDNLLDLSRLDAGEIRPMFRITTLRDILVPVAMEYEVVCRAKRLEFQWDVAPGHVRTDPSLLRRIVGNLLANAARYTNEGSVTLSAAAIGDDKIEVSVQDTGVGIDAKDQERVFDEFVQLDNPGRARDKGVGLGLSIVKRVCHLLNLDLHLSSAPGKGTRIGFSMPLVQPTSEQADIGPAEPISTEMLRDARIWVLEDDPLVQDAIRRLLLAWGARPTVVSDPDALFALKRPDEDWPDAIMLDDMLQSGYQGLEVANRLRQHLPAERLMLLTGNVDAQRIMALEDSGLTVLRKPIASAQLLQCLRSALEAPAIAPALAEDSGTSSDP